MSGRTRLFEWPSRSPDSRGVVRKPARPTIAALLAFALLPQCDSRTPSQGMEYSIGDQHCSEPLIVDQVTGVPASFSIQYNGSCWGPASQVFLAAWADGKVLWTYEAPDSSGWPSSAQVDPEEVRRVRDAAFACLGELPRGSTHENYYMEMPRVTIKVRQGDELRAIGWDWSKYNERGWSPYVVKAPPEFERVWYEVIPLLRSVIPAQGQQGHHVGFGEARPTAEGPLRWRE